jgi:hypothetical protein
MHVISTSWVRDRDYAVKLELTSMVDFFSDILGDDDVSGDDQWLECVAVAGMSARILVGMASLIG